MSLYKTDSGIRSNSLSIVPTRYHLDQQSISLYKRDWGSNSLPIVSIRYHWNQQPISLCKRDWGSNSPTANVPTRHLWDQQYISLHKTDRGSNSQAIVYTRYLWDQQSIPNRGLIEGATHFLLFPPSTTGISEPFLYTRQIEGATHSLFPVPLGSASIFLHKTDYMSNSQAIVPIRYLWDQ